MCLVPFQALHYAGKLAVLEALLGCILDGERLRCVVVSSSTAALDLVGGLCAARGWGTVRIDGATNPAARQEVVEGFNLYSRGQARASQLAYLRAVHYTAKIFQGCALA